jgi:hypothetical protein
LREPRRRWKHRARKGRRNLADERQRGYGTTLQSTVAAPAFVFWLLCYRGRRGFEGCKRSAVGFPPLPWRALPRIGPPRGRAKPSGKSSPAKRSWPSERRPEGKTPENLAPARRFETISALNGWPLPKSQFSNSCAPTVLSIPTCRAQVQSSFHWLPVVSCVSFDVCCHNARGGAKAPPAFFIPGQW